MIRTTLTSSFLVSCAGALGLGALAMGVLSGCDTQAYCFANCETTSTSGTASSMTTGGGGTGGNMFSSSTGFATVSSTGTGTCVVTNNGVEVCDGLDNDCNLSIDDVPGLDLNDPKTCGVCTNNCYSKLLNVDPQTIMCAPSADPGNVPGVCSGTCTDDYFDLDSDGSCEYYCVESAPDDALCNAKDDDCDGLIDEDVDLCTSTTDCGKCGGNCVIINGSAKCTHTGSMACNPSNTVCEIAACDPGFYDLDQSVTTGCEYACTPTGPELCNNGVDDDCDGKVDGADTLNDPAIGVACFGDPKGICGQAAHAGTTSCVAGVVQCTGPNVLVPGQVAETCNSADDDCDGVNDDAPTDAGAGCGVSNTGPCHFGTTQCQGGVLNCVGAVGPMTETCNGQDDNCDGFIDKTGMTQPADSVGACNVPAFQGNANSCEALGTCTTPCTAGSKSCVGGTIQCIGSVVPAPGANDACGVDTNCDGSLTNQPNKQTDVLNCGTCGNNCNTAANANHATTTCAMGSCMFTGCQSGYFDLNGDQICEYACTPTGPEVCDGTDNDCDGLKDENLTPPSVVSICGVSPAATGPECTTGVTVACTPTSPTTSAWKCTFPANVCNPTCATPNIEICDNLDNDCDGIVNENVANYNKPCASDDGLPAPGHGACRTTGTFQCATTTTTSCKFANGMPIMKADCATLPGGCTELCDAVDNDCDGSVDEPKSTPGTNATNYYKPKVTKIGAAQWIMTYEASRPLSTTTTPGTGNGYWTTANTPAGTPLDKTPACSEQSKIPWFNVTGREAEQTCTAMGGALCSTAVWQTACNTTAAPVCKWGYNPRGAACTSSYTASKFCNLGISFDFDAGTAGDQDGLLPTRSALLQNCSADWSGLFPPAPTQNIFDITGNLRELTLQTSNTAYKVMGGAFDTQSEAGAECGFSFYSVDQNFKFFDSGFRCCFTTDPTQ